MCLPACVLVEVSVTMLFTRTMVCLIGMVLLLDFQVLATTRNHIEGVNAYVVGEMGDFEILLGLFYAYDLKIRQKEWGVEEIIEEVCHHTLTVEMDRTMLLGRLTSLEPLH